MRKLQIILILSFILSTSALCRADSIVISFEGGKTQTMVLEGAIKSITAVQYLPSKDLTQPTPVSAAPQAHSVKPSSVHESTQAGQQPVPLKPVVKFKWAEPVGGQ